VALPDLLKIHPDFGKGGAGLAEAIGGAPSLRDLLVNHQGAIYTTAERVEQIVIAGAQVVSTADDFTATAGQTEFPLSFEPLGAVEVKVNGQTQAEGADFDVTGGIGARKIFWHSDDFGIQEGDRIQVFYLRNL